MKYLPHIVIAATLAVLTACGGGGGGNTAAPTAPTVPTTPPQAVDYRSLANRCVAPRAGVAPDGHAYTDLQGSLNDELRWVRAFIDETYLWYKEVPASINMADYRSPVDYFDVLKTPLITASGRPKDAFHFTYPSAVWDAVIDSGVSLGYGISWYSNDGPDSRYWAVGTVEPGSPAAAAGVLRGDRLVSVDGVSIDDMSVAGTERINAGLFPAGAGEVHRFTLQRAGVAVAASLTAQNVVAAPVQNAKVINTPTGAVGYLQFNDHNALAESGLLKAVATLKQANINDLVLDMRYNGGGYLVIANELAYMIAGPVATSGKAFSRDVYNDKTPVQAPELFQSRSVGLSPALLGEGTALPTLDLKRVTILTSPATCSASEAVINGLRGIDVEVNLIGGETCGKPYGFSPEDNCGTTYFAIQLQVHNDKGFGDYADGFAPTCAAEDDLTHALGDPAERLLATALSYRANGVCPAASRSARMGGSPGISTRPKLVRPAAKEIAILQR